MQAVDRKRIARWRPHRQDEADAAFRHPVGDLMVRWLP